MDYSFCIFCGKPDNFVASGRVFRTDTFDFEGNHIRSESGGRPLEFICVKCGSYFFDSTIDVNSGKVRSMMYYYLQHRANNRTVYFTSSHPESIQNEFETCVYISESKLLAMYPKTLNEKIDMIVLNLGKEIVRWGDTIHAINSGSLAKILEQKLHGNLFACENILPINYNDVGFHNWTKELSGTLEILQDYGYLKRKGASGSDIYTFTVDGWKHLGDLQAKNSELPQAFVAMWFDKEGSMDTVRDSIKQAITDAGYVPIIIDEKEHNNQIVPEILYEIQNSKFLVADLCGHRNGVYYEAGYAKGLGKEVILTCRKSDFSGAHFDVSQQSTVIYEEDDDLYGKLLKRIEVTVGKR